VDARAAPLGAYSVIQNSANAQKLYFRTHKNLKHFEEGLQTPSPDPIFYLPLVISIHILGYAIGTCQFLISICTCSPFV